MRYVIIWALAFGIMFASVGTQEAYAFSSFVGFGGKIQNTKAKQISSLESADYTCVVPGTSFEIKPVGKNTETSYLVPVGTKSKTNNETRPGQWVLGLFNRAAKTVVTCTLKGTPPVTQTVSLNPVSLYGTSK